MFFFSVLVAKWLKVMVDAVGHYGTEIYKAIFDLRCCQNLDEGQRGTATCIGTSPPQRAVLSALGSRIWCQWCIVSY